MKIVHKPEHPCDNDLFMDSQVEPVSDSRGSVQNVSLPENSSLLVDLPEAQDVDSGIIAKEETVRPPRECFKCGKCCRCKISLEKQKSTHGYLCQTCGRKFGLQDELDIHEEMRHGLKEKCSKCPYKTISICHLKRHIKLVHDASYDYQCNICDKKFKMEYNMQTHKRRAHTQIRCNDCDEILESLSALTQHMQIKHSKLVFPCTVCKLLLKSQNTLDKHFKLHSCPFCNKIIKSDLKRHVLLHTNSKPYVCRIYGMAFPNYTAMFRHRKKHTSQLSQ